MMELNLHKIHSSNEYAKQNNQNCYGAGDDVAGILGIAGTGTVRY